MVAAGEEEELLQSTLKEVEFIAKNTKTLEAFGKETLSQSQIFLDLKSSGVPLLLQTLKRKEKNWKVRYWACDMLGYVGEAEAEKELLSLVSDQSQARLLRLRALDSILEIERRAAGIGKKELRTKLYKLAKKIKDVRLKRKIQKTIRRIKF